MMTKAIIFAVLSILSFSDAGVSYIRWGRTVCPAGEILLYKGYMASSQNTQAGSGANYQCLHESPVFVRGVTGHQSPAANIHGVEFDIGASHTSLFSTASLPSGTALNYQDIPCVRCHVPSSADAFVLPGRPDCGAIGYELSYKGFLVSAANPVSGGNRAEFVCMDEAPEGKVGPVANNQGQVSPVEANCGSLPCPSYQEGMEITCAVCTY